MVLKLFGYMKVPFEPDVFYIIGSGASIEQIMEKLGLPNTLLGIDMLSLFFGSYR